MPCLARYIYIESLILYRLNMTSQIQTTMKILHKIDALKRLGYTEEYVIANIVKKRVTTGLSGISGRDTEENASYVRELISLVRRVYHPE